MPGSRFEVFDDVGHFPQLERPQEFSGLLREWMQTTAAADIDTTEIREQLIERAGGDLLAA